MSHLAAYSLRKPNCSDASLALKTAPYLSGFAISILLYRSNNIINTVATVTRTNETYQ